MGWRSLFAPRADEAKSAPSRMAGERCGPFQGLEEVSAPSAGRLRARTFRASGKLFVLTGRDAGAEIVCRLAQGPGAQAGD